MGGIRLGFLALLMHSGICLAQSTTPASAPAAAPDQLPSLIKQLSSEQWQKRQQAQDQIAAMGDAALKSVQEMTKSDDPQLRASAENILQRIASASSSHATMVSLHFQNSPAQEVYEALYKQANAPLPADTSLWQHLRGGLVSIDVDNVPFWSAFRKLRQQTNLSLEGHGTRAMLSEDHFNSMRGLVYTKGPFMVVADNTFPGMFQKLTVFVEPKIKVIGRGQEPQIETALDGDGKSVLDHRDAREDSMVQTDGNVFDFPVNLHGRGPGGVVYIKGTIRAKAAISTNKAEIADIQNARNRTETRNGRKFLVNLMKIDDNSYRLSLVAYVIDGVGAKVQYDLVDADGKSLKTNGHGGMFSPDRSEYESDFHREDCGAPSKLLMEFPTASEEIRIPFEFGQNPNAEDKQ